MLTVINGGVMTTYNMTGDVNIVLEPGVYEVPDPDDFIFEIDPYTFNWTIPVGPTNTITNINSIEYPTNSPVTPVISITIPPVSGAPVNVIPIDGGVILKAPELLMCDVRDPIDEYIAPYLHAGECRILDKCYSSCSGSDCVSGYIRATLELTSSAIYGFDGGLAVDELDTTYDTEEVTSADDY
jgi:hypothetical protein